jgi:hypothetical protein
MLRAVFFVLPSATRAIYRKQGFLQRVNRSAGQMRVWWLLKEALEGVVGIPSAPWLESKGNEMNARNARIESLVNDEGATNYRARCNGCGWIGEMRTARWGASMDATQHHQLNLRGGHDDRLDSALQQIRAIAEKRAAAASSLQ